MEICHVLIIRLKNHPRTSMILIRRRTPYLQIIYGILQEIDMGGRPEMDLG